MVSSISTSSPAPPIGSTPITRIALIIVALIVAYGTLFSVRRQCRPRD
jgi:hypothetical protein